MSVILTSIDVLSVSSLCVQALVNEKFYVLHQAGDKSTNWLAVSVNGGQSFLTFVIVHGHGGEKGGDHDAQAEQQQDGDSTDP